MPYYDFDKINEVPLQDICKQYGIVLKETSTGFVGRIRDEKTPSFIISKAKGVWSDFGGGQSGKTPISLVQYIEGVDYKVAAEKLGNMFGINPKTEKSEWTGLTNCQYKEIGVIGQRVTMNIDINLEKVSLEKAEEIDSKYGISMVELAQKNTKLYNMIVKNKALPIINECRRRFFYLSDRYKNEKSYMEKELYKGSAKKLENEINRKVELLKRALKDNHIDLSYLKVSIDGAINKEIGKISYKDFQKKTGINRYLEVDKRELDKLKDSDINYSAFIKGGDKYNLVVKEGDLDKALSIIERKYEKQYGNINYSELKKMGELKFLQVSKGEATKLMKELNKFSIKICAFDKGNLMNIAITTKDFDKVVLIENKLKKAMTKER